jgi:hypothetical protein
MSFFRSLYGKLFGIDPGNGDLLLSTTAGVRVPVVRGASNKVVTISTTTATLTQDSHAEKLIRLSRAAGITVTLPLATGTGAEYKFVIPTSLSGTTKIKVASTSNTLQGHVQVDASLASNAPISFTAGTTADTISLNGTTTGGKLGDYFKLIDEKTGVWHVEGFIRSTGAGATPFVVSV